MSNQNTNPLQSTLLRRFRDRFLPSEVNLHVPPAPQYVLLVQRECAEAAYHCGLLTFDNYLVMRAGKVAQSKVSPDVWLAMPISDVDGVRLRLG